MDRINRAIQEQRRIISETRVDEEPLNELKRQRQDLLAEVVTGTDCKNRIKPLEAMINKQETTFRTIKENTVIASNPPTRPLRD